MTWKVTLLICQLESVGLYDSQGTEQGLDQAVDMPVLRWLCPHVTLPLQAAALCPQPQPPAPFSPHPVV